MQIAAALVATIGAITLTGFAQSPAQVTVHGRVVAADTRNPLRHARIQSTTDNGAPLVALTDADGRFAVPASTQATTRLTVAKPGYLRMLFEIPRIDADVELRIPKAAALSGRVANTAGEPVVGMSVTAEAFGGIGTKPTLAARTETDDRGDYRLAGLQPGTYVVSIDPNVIPQPDQQPAVVADRSVSFPEARLAEVRSALQKRSYYPNVETAAAAQPIVVSGGDERTGLDFTVPAVDPIDVIGGAVATVIPRGAGPNQQPIPRSDRAVIRGRITSSDGRLVSKANVRLESNGQAVRIPAAITDEQGRYEFQRLGAGTYTVLAVKSGFNLTGFGEGPGSRAEPIELRSDETRNNVDITLWRPAVIAGHIVDDLGEPVEGATVHLLQIRFSEGRRRLVDAFNPFIRGTDDRGAYRIYGVPPGAYIVSARVGESVGTGTLFDLPGYSTSYYPASANPADSQQVTVGFGIDAAPIDVALVRAPTARVSGVALDSKGAPLATGLLLAPSRRSGALAVNAVTATVGRDGRFEFAGVSPGEYVIQASRGRDEPFDEGESVSQFVTVGNADVTDLAIRASRGSTFKGRLIFDGDSSIEPSAAGLDLQAIPVDMDRTPQTLESPASARIERDNSFELAGLTGPRLLRLSENTRVWTLKAVRVNGRDVTDTPLPAGTAAESITGLEVVVTNRIARVGGTVVDNRDRAVADAEVIVFATDTSSWTEGSRFLVSSPVQKNGTFVVSNLPPGVYYAAAVTALAPGEWRDPDLLNSLVVNATQITVVEGETVDTRLRLITR